MTPIVHVVDVAANCGRHRPALFALLEDPLGTELTPDERGHLDTCDSCRRELADVVLMGIAVRRTMSDATTATVPTDAWPRLRARIERGRARQRPGRAASPVLGLALGMGLAIALLLPLGLPVSGTPPLHEAGVDPAAIVAAGHRDAEEEARQLRATVLAGKEAASDGAISRARAELIRQEATPVSEWRAPSRSPLNATAR